MLHLYSLTHKFIKENRDWWTAITGIFLKICFQFQRRLFSYYIISENKVNFWSLILGVSIVLSHKSKSPPTVTRWMIRSFAIFPSISVFVLMSMRFNALTHSSWTTRETKIKGIQPLLVVPLSWTLVANNSRTIWWWLSLVALNDGF